MASRHRTQAVFLLMRVGADVSAPLAGGTVALLDEAIALRYSLRILSDYNSNVQKTADESSIHVLSFAAVCNPKFMLSASRWVPCRFGPKPTLTSTVVDTHVILSESDCGAPRLFAVTALEQGITGRFSRHFYLLAPAP